MATLTLTLPKPLHDWIEDRARAGGFASECEFVSDLIQRDRERMASLAGLQREIDAGLASGPSPHTKASLLERTRFGG